MPLKDFIAPITATAGAIFGLINEKHEDKRQLEQQEKLQQLQMRGQKSMGKFNQKLGEEMWDYTNYENQMKHIKAAGLNPGLLYGKGGGGGVTASVAPGNVSGAEAPRGTGKEIQEMAGMGMQIGLQAEALKSQIEVNKSIANLNNTTAEKKAGVDTTETKQNIQKLIAETTNTEAKTALTEIQQQIAKIEQTTESDILDKGYKIEKIGAEFDVLSQKAQQIYNENYQWNQSKDAIIATIKQTAINTLIEGQLKQAQITLTETQIENIKQTIKESNKTIEEKTAKIQQLLSAAGLMDKEKSLLTAQTIIKGVGTALGALGNLKGSGTKTYNTNNYIPRR